VIGGVRYVVLKFIKSMGLNKFGISLNYFRVNSGFCVLINSRVGFRGL
jgi:hypothetical protein